MHFYIFTFVKNKTKKTKNKKLRETKSELQYACRGVNKKVLGSLVLQVDFLRIANSYDFQIALHFLI